MKKRFKDLQRKQLSEALERVEPLRSIERPRTGWIKAIRTALDMPQEYLAKRLGVSKGAIAQYEAGEAEGSVTVATLRKAANALDCDFVYALVPRAPIHEIRLRRAQALARRTVDAVAQTMALEDQSIPSSELDSRVNDLALVILDEHPRTIWDDR